jgi:4-hydroxybenzoate polyprenyltransferase
VEIVTDHISFISRWQMFIQERFSPLAHAVMIVAFFCANASAASISTGSMPGFGLTEALGALVVFLTFFHLRIFDEMKDYSTDLTVHPERPLPRKLISLSEAGSFAAALMLAEVALGFAIGPQAFVAVLCVAGYSLLMYKEFFARKWIRPRLVTYALTHTLISCWMSLFIFSAVAGRHFWQAPKAFGIFVFVNWLLFDMFEFGRKTYGREEERSGVDSYSRRLGPSGASVALLIMAATAVIAASYLGRLFGLAPAFSVLFWILFGAMFAAAFFYVRSNNRVHARTFRTACSLFIIVFYAILTIAILAKGGGL